MPRNTIAMMKIRLIFMLMNTHMKMLNTRLSGARTEMRRIIWKALWRLLTSVVMRVIRPAVLNLSMLANEKVWMCLNMASRKL